MPLIICTSIKFHLGIKVFQRKQCKFVQLSLRVKACRQQSIQTAIGRLVTSLDKVNVGRMFHVRKSKTRPYDLMLIGQQNK